MATESDAAAASARETLVTALAVCGMVCFWCCVGAIVCAIKRRRGEAASMADTAVVLVPASVFASFPVASLVA